MIFTALYLVATLAAAASAETLLRTLGSQNDSSFVIGSAAAATLSVRHRFTDTGTSTPSHYALGASPQSELVQASDGNYYGTTENGGTGACPDPYGSGAVVGCGTVFRMAPDGSFTTLYSFPYSSSTGAPNGAYPSAGLIQGADGFLYGVARFGGGFGECNGILGCGTLFRISMTGTFTLLHQFCSGDGCANPAEGGQPTAHLIQLPDQSLCGTTAEGGYENEGTVFCSSTSGGVETLHDFHDENGTDGSQPLTALLAAPGGTTLYGTTATGGTNGGGTVFSIAGGVLTTIYAFPSNGSSAPGSCFSPLGALIFGTDGRLYGTTPGSDNGYGCIFSLNTDGSGYRLNYEFPSGSNFPAAPQAGLLLAGNGLMYGTTFTGSIVGAYGGEGTAFSFDPVKGKFIGLADCSTNTGASLHAAFIEGADKYLYSTAPLYGGSNKLGTDTGTVFRLVPELKE